ncbi:MAG: methyl-accepting chemotaxis protein, partial [Allorhizobium sp.]
MSFIDRLLQSRRIVTKVLLFVVPLVLLMAGVGLLGYFTATTLNGHMTVTRATIGNISDLEKLQQGLQEFSLDPTEQSREALLVAIDNQEKGLGVLGGVLAKQAQTADLAALTGLPGQMRDQTAGLWDNKTTREALDEGLTTAVAALQTESQQIVKQVDFVRTDLSGKERFAKELLFDASAFKSLLDRLGKLRVGVQMAFTPEEQLAEAKLYLAPMQKDLTKATAIASDKGKVLIGEVAAAIAKIEAILGQSAPDDARATELGRVLSELVEIEQKITLQAAKNGDVAADRFVSLDKLVAEQKELMALVDNAALTIATVELRVQQMLGSLDDQSRQIVIGEVDSLQKVASRISELGAKNSALRDFPQKIAPHLAAIVEKSQGRLDVGQDWQAKRLAANAAVSSAMESLRNFVSQAQEIGREDSERSATISVITMVVGTLLAIIGGLMLVETLRAPLKRITGVM